MSANRRGWIGGLAVWALFLAAAAGRHMVDSPGGTEMPAILRTLFNQVQATELISIPRFEGGVVQGYFLVKARLAAAASIRDPETTPIKPLIIDAMHGFLNREPTPATDIDPDELASFIADGLKADLGADTVSDLDITIKYSAVAR